MSRVLQKLTGPQLVKKFIGTFIAAFTNAHLYLFGKINPATVCTVPVAKDQSDTLGMFRNIVSFYGDESLAPRPTPPVGGPPLSAIGDPLCNIAASTHHI